jgi:macrolide-specific efflux system membrane fusion protein
MHVEDVALRHLFSSPTFLTCSRHFFAVTKLPQSFHIPCALERQTVHREEPDEQVSTMDRIEESRLTPAADAASRVKRVRFVPHGRRARVVVLCGALLVAGGAGYFGWRAWTSPADTAAYTTAVVVRGNLEDTVTATGILQPRDYVDVGTQVSGQLKKLHVQVGQTVKAGQLLAEIDPTVYLSRVDANRAQLRTQQAQLADREAQLALAEQQFQRQTNLTRENATTTDALQSAEAALKSAKAQIGVLNAQIEQTRSTLRGDEANLNYTKIYAPMSGTVVSENAKQGQTLNANQQAPIVVRIADLSTMTVQSQVSEADVSKLRVGQDVYFTTLGSDSKRWHGKLRQINPTPEVLNNVVLYNALFDVENADRALMTQMTAQVFFVVAQAKDAVIVPVSALRPVGSNAASGERRANAGSQGKSAGAADAQGAAAKGGGRARGADGGIDPRARFASGRATVRVVKADGSIEAREVRVGVLSRVSAQIVSGLEPGEKVVSGQAQAAPIARAKASDAPRMQPRI